MTRLLLRCYIKRFFAIFIALIITGGLSAGIFNAFLSSKDHLKNDPAAFFHQYGYVDEEISLKLDERSEYMGLYDIEGVESIDMRLSLDVHLKKDDGRIINSRILTYSDAENEIMKRYVNSEIPRDESKYNIAVSNKFATHNNFRLGDSIQLTLLDFTQSFYVYKIVDTVEGIFPSFNPYVWIDDYDFGYLYFLEDDLNKVIKTYAPLLSLWINSSPEAKEKYQALIDSTNLNPVDLNHIGDHFASTITNDIIIKNAPGYSEEDVLNRVNGYLSERGIKPNFILKGDDTAPRQYMKSVNKQLGVAFIFLPVFFYLIAMVLLGLFIGQIIRQTTRNIGILLSNGASRKDIVLILLSFTAIISFIACLLAIPIGYGLSSLVTSTMIHAYFVPTIGSSLSIPVVLIGASSLFAMNIISTLLASFSIFKITPKDASLNNEARRKPLPRRMEKTIAKMPFTLQSAANSIFQNKRRFFISSFSITASLTMILLCGFFHVSKTELINQGCERRMHYDCQLYLEGKVDDAYVDELKSEPSITQIMDCEYSYLEIKNERGDYQHVECLAFNPLDNQGMVDIPDADGHNVVTLQEDGLIMPKSYADLLGVVKGDTVIINDAKVLVSDISFQYYHPIAYCSKTQLNAIATDYVSSLLINTTDEIALSQALSKKAGQSLIVFTSSLEKDLHRVFDTLDIFLFIMSAFALSITLIILFIMSISALQEQIYQLSIYRAIGMKVSAIMKIFICQSGVQLALATALAAPISVISSQVLFGLASSARQTYPFIFSFPYLGLALLFVILVIGICHLFSTHRVRRIDLSANLRSYE